MERIIQRFESFAAADEADAKYYRSLTPSERLNILLTLVQEDYETERRLERVYRIVELAQS